MPRHARTSFQFASTALTWEVWLGSRAAALVLGGIFIWALLKWTPIQPLLEAPAIQAVSDFTFDRDFERPSSVTPLSQPIQQPMPPKTRQQPTSKAPLARQSAVDPMIPDQATKQRVDGAPPSNPPAVFGASNRSPPQIATVPSTQPSSGEGVAPTSPAANSGTASFGRVSSGTMAILRARECARLDIRDRPADCPPNEELMRMLAQERGPKYRPKNADAFSRNELAWRGIPPPCLKDGENGAVKGMGACLRFGNTPSRVRSPREICEAKGIGACEPPPSQAAVNSAIEQVKRKTGN
ncbi:MAG: hypothetical protein RLZZ157_617 [Pseudomonadota bacterium]|jgi:hypothetical protein